VAARERNSLRATNLNTMLKKMFLAYFKAVLQYLPRMTAENHWQLN
jgi:hypothetical protein